MQPLSNAYVTVDAADRMEPFYPLHVRVCERCFLVQLPLLQTPEEIFREYAYLSSMSDSWLDHCRRYAQDMIARFALGPSSFVVEIASNDGYLLRFFKERGFPSSASSRRPTWRRIAETAGIPSLPRFFGADLATELVREGKRADLLVGNNVLAHVPDLNDFVKGLATLLAPEGVLTMEFPHLGQLIANNQFDTIYHEHFSYFSFATAKQVFAAHGITIFDVDELPTHGGSLRIYGCLAASSRPPSERVGRLLANEERQGLRGLETYTRFGEQAREVKRKLLEFMIGRRRKHDHVIGYGAAAKGNTLLNYCGMRTDFLDYVVDRSPLKQGKLLPGTRIPIEAPERIRQTRPRCVLVLPWNIKDEIAEQLAFVKEWGGDLVVPIPEVEILP